MYLNMSSSYKYTIPKVQRALVLQGGGALGAYQRNLKNQNQNLERTKRAPPQ